jgi:hypothetical protein
MSNREYPYYTGRVAYRGKQKGCECCERSATHIVDMQLSIFRGDDESYLVCEPHATLARMNYEQFLADRRRRQEFLRERVDAQHEETGRMWNGERRNLPPRYSIVTVSESVNK